MITLLEVHKHAEKLCRQNDEYTPNDRYPRVWEALKTLLGEAPKGFDDIAFYGRILSFGFIPDNDSNTMELLAVIAKSQQPNLEMPMSYQAALVGINMLFDAHKVIDYSTLMCSGVKTLNIETMSNVIVQMRKYEQVFQQMGWKS